MPEPSQGEEHAFGVTRRGFMGAALAVGGIYLVASVPGTSDSHHSVEDGQAVGDELRFLSDDEAQTVDAILGRLIPGDAASPGAREAGVLFYIDHKLHEYEHFAEPAYIRGPFAQPIGEGTDEDAEDIVLVDSDQLYRYGYQADVFPREVYREGITGIDRLSRDLHGSRFSELSEEQQDQLLEVLDDIDLSEDPDGPEGPGDAMLERVETAFGEVDPGGFFSRVRTDAIEGMFADPKYGGNRDYAGWVMIGYPGAQRAWSPQQMLAPGVPRRPQALFELTPMHPDRRDSPAGDALEQPRSGVVKG